MDKVRSHRVWLRVHCFKPPQSRNERLDRLFDVMRQMRTQGTLGTLISCCTWLGWIDGLSDANTAKYLQLDTSIKGKHPDPSTALQQSRHLLKLITHTICCLGTTAENMDARPEELAYEYIIALQRDPCCAIAADSEKRELICPYDSHFIRSGQRLRFPIPNSPFPCPTAGV